MFFLFLWCLTYPHVNTCSQKTKSYDNSWTTSVLKQLKDRSFLSKEHFSNEFESLCKQHKPTTSSDMPKFKSNVAELYMNLESLIVIAPQCPTKSQQEISETHDEAPERR